MNTIYKKKTEYFDNIEKNADVLELLLQLVDRHSVIKQYCY